MYVCEINYLEFDFDLFDFSLNDKKLYDLAKKFPSLTVAELTERITGTACYGKYCYYDFEKFDKILREYPHETIPFARTDTNPNITRTKLLIRREKNRSVYIPLILLKDFHEKETSISIDVPKQYDIILKD